MHVVAIIAAGGRGDRLGARMPKQLLAIGGRPILQRSVEAFLRSPHVHEIVVAVHPEIAAQPPVYLQLTAKPLSIVPGGDRRQDSVANAFSLVADRADLVVIHDAARPFVTPELIARTIAAAAEAGAAIAALQASDTVKQGGGADEAPVVVETLPRERIYLAQTPQAFRCEVLRVAIELGRGAGEATDEATLAERAGFAVRLVRGETANIKITTAEDLAAAEGLASRLDGGGGRGGDKAVGHAHVGIGYDLHRLVAGRPLVLGGVTIPFDRGLIGHSDADVLCHAVTDALLGAASAGDIGRHFPDTDPRWKDADSLELLAQAAEIVSSAGFAIDHVDAVVIAERPKIGPYIEQLQASLAGAMCIRAEQVSVKGKTNEGVGELGRSEAIAVHAVASLHRTA